jgi:hypothetical protein
LLSIHPVFTTYAAALKDYGFENMDFMEAVDVADFEDALTEVGMLKPAHRALAIRRFRQLIGAWGLLAAVHGGKGHCFLSKYVLHNLVCTTRPCRRAIWPGAGARGREPAGRGVKISPTKSPTGSMEEPECGASGVVRGSVGEGVRGGGGAQLLAGPPSGGAGSVGGVASKQTAD